MDEDEIDHRIKLSQILRHIRRWYLIIFRPYYVMNQLSKRKGNCKDCGCCRKRPCNYYDPKKHCMKHPNYPFICKICPIDEKDMSPFLKKHCEFYWNSNGCDKHG